jgi:hypothetical protein
VVEFVFLLSAGVKMAMIGYGWPVSMSAHLGSRAMLFHWLS